MPGSRGRCEERGEGWALGFRFYFKREGRGGVGFGVEALGMSSAAPMCFYNMRPIARTSRTPQMLASWTSWALASPRTYPGYSFSKP